MPPPLVRLRISPHPPCASCLAGFCIASHHAATSCLPAPLPLIAPLSCVLSGALSLFMPPLPICMRLCLLLHPGCHVASHHAATSCLPVPPPLIPPLLRLLSGWLLSCLSSRCCLPSACASTSYHAPLPPLVRLVVPSPLVTPPTPIQLCL
jgi:hypothetical protein